MYKWLTLCLRHYGRRHEGTKAERGTEGHHDRRPFALWTAGSSYPTPSARTTRLRQWCHAHAEEGLLASESPGQHVGLTPKFDQQLLANFCLGCWPPGNGGKTGDRPAGAGSAERGPAAELKMRRGWRLEGTQTWSEGCVLPVLADLGHGPKEPNPLPLSV